MISAAAIALVLAASPLEPAMASYQAGDFEKARSALEALLYPLRLDDERLQRDAHLLLSATYFALDEAGRAEEEAVKGFALDPKATVDPVTYPPDFQSFAASVRQKQGSRISALFAERSALRREPERPTAAPAAPPSVERHRPSAAWSLVPFGTPQFQNGEDRKGFVLAASQGACALAAIGGLVGALALRGADGKYSAEDAELARTLNVTYLVGSYCFAGLYVYGLVDGLVSR